MLGKNLITAAAGNAGGEVLGVEDVFSTWLYTGNGSTQTITNGIDLSGKGGLTWVKCRSAANAHVLCDTARGANKVIRTNSTNAEATYTTFISAFNSDGFSLSNDSDVNASSNTYASWTFRKAPGFFDVVTFTAGSSTNRRISHSLGSTPGTIFIKSRSAIGAWYVYHRSLGRSAYIILNTTGASTSQANFWGTSDPTSTDFGIDESAAFAPGTTAVAYVFAHDEQIFGEGGDQSVIKCGSYTGNGSTTGPVVDLGWEPQWLLVKASSSAQQWVLIDSMRGIPNGSAVRSLNPNASDAEASYSGVNVDLLATGFQPRTTDGWFNLNGATYIYIAIRRGPMKTPTDATKVFSALARTGTGTTTTTAANLTPDTAIINYRPGSGDGHFFFDRLRGQNSLDSTATGAETSNTLFPKFDQMSGVQLQGAQYNSNGASMIDWYFRRAPGFFDVVAYTGTGSARTVSHNLGAVPELMIVKARNLSTIWCIYSASIGNGFHLRFSNAGKVTDSTAWNSTSPTSTSFTVGTANYTNGAYNYVAYLFASCPGVSKVGSYTGSGTTKDIDCGFTNGARFVMIYRVDTSGYDWYVWDTARGIVSGNDPYLLLNTTDAEVTNTDYIDPLSSGFQISSTAPAAINANGGSYIFLAIA